MGRPPQVRRARDVYQRGGRWWGVVQREHGEAARVSLGLPATAPRADAVAAWLEHVRAGRHADTRARTPRLGDALDAFLAELHRRGRSLATQEIAKRKAGHFVRLWGRELPLDRLTAQMVAEYIRTREGEKGRHERSVQPLTIRRELDVLRGALKLAYHHGRLRTDPARILPLEYAPRYTPRRRWLTEDELRRVVAVLEPKRRAWVALAVGAGCRRGEVTRVLREHVDLARGVVTVLGTKTTGSRAEVPITRLQEPWIQMALDLGRKAGQLVPAWPNVSRDLAAACVRAGVERCTPNDLRRTLGHWLRHAGVEPHLIGRVLRHRDSTMAELVYAEGAIGYVQELLAVRLAVRQPVQPEAPERRQRRRRA